MPEEVEIPIAALLPDQLKGWRTSETIPLRSAADMYAYMDGGAELYLSYGFRQAISRRYTNDRAEVVAEIYDLIESRNAFGVFSQSRENEDLLLGQGGFRLPGALFFWKHHYYISLSAWEPDEEANDFLLLLGKYIEAQISDIGPLPLLVHALPSEGLVPYGFLYFHHYVWLNAYFFISDNNVLLINNDTDALLARYSFGGRRLHLLIVEYPDTALAFKAFESFGLAFFPGGLTGNCVQMSDHTWLAAALSGRLISIAFGESEVQTRNLMQEAVKQYKIITG